MATGSDRLVGYGLVLLSAVIFTYYTLWVVILPFVEDDHLVKNLFLPRIYALVIPVVAGVIALLALGSFIVLVSIGSKKSVQKKTN